MNRPSSATPLRFTGRVKAAMLVAGLACAPLLAQAQGFAVFLSPSRFDLPVKAGESRREVLEFHHVGREIGRYRVYTNDWEFKPDYAVQFNDALAPDSCRPWVALERRELSLTPNQRYRFRFEVTVPPGTPARECRFALMVEGADPTQAAGQNLNLPVAGRIGVIVYLRVGDVEADLAVKSAGVQVTEGKPLPTLDVANRGNAHGRLEGFLTAKDAAGNSIELSPDNVPILPGTTRRIPLRPVGEEGKAPPALQYPLTVKGTLEWGKRREPLELRFER